MRYKLPKIFATLVTLSLITLSIPKPLYAALPGAHSSTDGSSGDVFLGGNYIEVGISKYGSFGTANAKPAGFYGSAARNQIGLVANFAGFGNTPDTRIDYFMPGTQEERWVIGYKISGTASTASNAARNSATGISNNTVTDTSSGNTLSAYSVGTYNSVLKVEQTIQFTTNDSFFKNTVVLTNVSAGAIDSVRYMRTFDPDNTVDKGGASSTRNEVKYTYAADGKAVVEARTSSDSDPVYTATGSRAPILFYSNDSRAVASTFGFANTDPYTALAYDSPRAKNSVLTGDNAITMTVDAGTLQPNGSTTFIYYTSLDSRDFDTVISDIQSSENPTPTPTAVASVPHYDAPPQMCPDSPPSQAPDLYQVDAERTTATTYFAPVADKATYYYASYGYTENTKEFGVQIGLPDAKGAQKYTINKLEPNVDYYIKIRAGNNCAPGPWSKTLKIHTSGKQASFYKTQPTILTLSSAIGVLGAHTEQPHPQADTARSCKYTVQPGDSLWLIAVKTIGRGKDFRQLQSQNTALYPSLTDSTKIKPGWQLTTCN